MPEDFAGLQEMVWDWPEQKYHRHELGLLRRRRTARLQHPHRPGGAVLHATLERVRQPDPLAQHTKTLAIESAALHAEAFRIRNTPIVLHQRGSRSFEFFHSEHRNQKTMREYHPLPRVRIHPETAAQYGIQDGQWVWIENQRGRCRQVAWVTEGMKPGCASAEHGWWFPETEGAEPNLYGVFDSNINNLTSMMVIGVDGIRRPLQGPFVQDLPRDARERGALSPARW